MRDKLRSLEDGTIMSCTINLNSQHDGHSLQSVLEAPLEKKSGKLTWVRIYQISLARSLAELILVLV